MYIYIYIYIICNIRSGRVSEWYTVCMYVYYVCIFVHVSLGHGRRGAGIVTARVCMHVSMYLCAFMNGAKIMCNGAHGLECIHACKNLYPWMS
jgi:hypothetical protein